jgi:hypothetical protein
LVARLVKSLSFSDAVACLALFVALGGTVYAAGRISGKQIKKSSLPGNRIKPKTVPSNRIKPGSLTGRQVKPDSLSGAQIDESTLTGVSAAALADLQYEATTAVLPTGGRPGTVTSNCPAGDYVIGGGATLSNEERGYVNDSGPGPLRTGWTATGYSWFPGGVTITVTAICVPVEKPGGAVNNGDAASPPPVQYQPGG